jgi:hypothetical protein
MTKLLLVAVLLALSIAVCVGRQIYIIFFTLCNPITIYDVALRQNIFACRLVLVMLIHALQGLEEIIVPQDTYQQLAGIGHFPNFMCMYFFCHFTICLKVLTPLFVSSLSMFLV